jgi:hypothetical protein
MNQNIPTWKAFEIDSGPGGTHWEVTIVGENDLDMPYNFHKLMDVIKASRASGAFLEVHTVDWYYNAHEHGYFDIKAEA